MCSTGAASALISWPFSGLGQRKCLRWPLYSSIRSHQANKLRQSMAMAYCSPCSSAGIRAGSPTEAMSLPSWQYLQPRRVQYSLQTFNARGHNTATAATARRQKNNNSSSRSQPSQQLVQSISSLDSDSTSSSFEDEELSTGAEDLTGLPWYYDEVLIKEGWAATENEKEFWMAKAELFKRSTAVRAVAQLDPQWRFGVSYERLGGPIREDDEGSRTRSSEDKAPSGSLWFRRAKTKDPFAVVLIKVGSFYESVGYDAALLMEHAGYNPMGGNTIPRAGCPDYKIQELLQLLVEEAGLSVAMWEEEPDTKEHGSVRREQRPRKFAQLVTPENPSYLYGLSSISQDRHAEAPNLKGIALSSRGCSVFVLNRYSDVIMVYQGISTDSLWSLLVSDGSTAPVVYLHWPLDQPNPSTGPTSSKHEQDFLKLKRSLQEGGARVSIYKSVDPLLGFEERVKDALRWPVDKDIPHLPAWDAQNYWPGVRPLYHSTLMQLGLVSNPGVPSLADYMLPRSSNKVVRQVIRSLLVNPPPYDVAAATRRVVDNFGAGTAKPFSWDASGSITPQKVSLILSAGEGNDTFFQNMLLALGPVISTMDRSQSPALSGLVDDSWPLLCHTMGCQQQEVTQDNVLQAAQQAFAAIQKVVVAAGLYNNGSSTDGSTDEEPQMSKSLRHKPALPEDSSAAVQQTVESFSAFMEVYKKRVQPDVIKTQYEEADIAFGTLWAVLDGLMHTLIKQAHRAGLDLAPGELPVVFVDETNLSAWIKVPSAKLRTHMKDRPFQVLVCRDLDAAASERFYEVLPEQQVLHHPYDRNGLALKARDVFSCNLLDQALGSYRGAVAAANWAATKALQALSQQLLPIKLELSAAAQLGILLQSLYEHSAAAAAAGWSVPAVGLEEQLQSGVKFDEDSHQRGILELKGLQPYWMSRPRSTEERVCDDAPVCNDVELKGFMLLTGPNMAGKSTVLRSTAAAALCGSVGLAVPAAAGSLLPQLDAIMLRTFTGDAPSEELSAFGVEMNQMAGVLADARPGSLVLIDELGKGTEVGSGTALASAMIKELVEMGARGIFATHLHGLMDLTSDTPGLTNFNMQVAEQKTAAGRTRLVPTWQLVRGPSTKSLALEVAKEMGLPDKCIELAKKEYEKVKRLGGYKALIRIAAEAPVEEFEVEAAPTAEVNESVLSTEGDGIVVDSSSDSSGFGSNSNSSILRSISRRRRRRNSGSASSDVSNSDVKQQSQHERHQERVSQVVAILSNLAAAGGRSRGLSHPPEQPTLAAAAAATEAVDDSTPDEAAGLASSAAADLPEVHHLYRQGGLGPTGTRRTAGNQPPVAHLHAPVLYAAYFDRSGKWHAGESSKLAERWKSHTYRLGKQRVDMWYVVLDTTDGSIRSQLEGRLHLALDAAGVPLDSRRDAHRARRK